MTRLKLTYLFSVSGLFSFCISCQQVSARSPSEPRIGSRLQTAKHTFAKPNLCDHCHITAISATFISGPANEINKFLAGGPDSRTRYTPFQHNPIALTFTPTAVAAIQWPAS